MNIQTLDAVRRWSNLTLSFAQIAVTVLSFALGTSFYDTAGAISADPPIVPAGYAFTIWSVIYAGSVAYAIYQFSASPPTNFFLRRIGFLTASTFLGCCCWLLCVRFRHLPLTIPCILWMFVSLFGAFALLRQAKISSWQFRIFVVAPISIYFGWLSVAMFANVGSIAKAFGWWPALVSQSLGSIFLIVTAAILAVFILHFSGGNRWYGATIIWAVSAIAVRNQFELQNTSVALTCWIVLAVFLILLATHPFASRVFTHT